MIVPQIWVQWSPRSPWGTAPSSGLEGQSLWSASCWGSNICAIQEFALFELLSSFWAFLMSYTQFSFWVEFLLNWLFWAVHSDLKTDIKNCLTQGATGSSPWWNISCKNCFKRQKNWELCNTGSLATFPSNFHWSSKGKSMNMPACHREIMGVVSWTYLKVIGGMTIFFPRILRGKILEFTCPNVIEGTWESFLYGSFRRKMHMKTHTYKGNHNQRSMYLLL